MRRPETDGLRAVARVRRVREQDSRAGLQQAVREADEAAARLGALEARLAAGVTSEVDDLSTFVAARTHLLAVERAATAAQAGLMTARNLAHSAQAHWQHDKSRLKAIEMLQERRAEEARAEEQRVEARELDEISTQLWRRRNRREVIS
jgi:flagellar export protein FliJ